jgi:predicted TIM-barrel fold metal-dependent hydrolase
MAPTPGKSRIIALEEHYVDARVKEAIPPSDRIAIPYLGARLEDLSDLRLKEMDEAGIDLQVLSHAGPATQWLDAATAVPLARSTNDRLRQTVLSRPDRFAAFATLPTSDPKAAADELHRTVGELGFKGAMLHGLAAGQVFFDDKRFWTIFECAQALDVPIYVHPGPPHPAVLDAYLGTYLKEFPMLAGPAWGFTIETATTALRLVLSGVFEKYPRLNIIVGHLGEGLPFLLHRVSEALAREGVRGPRWFRDIFCEHVWITTSGNFSTPAMLCSMLEMGTDRILFSVDWPFVANKPGVEWMRALPISNDDKEKIMHGNATKLLRL